jgi:hypothetical protein
VDQPEYIHVVINHLPLLGLPVAMLALTAALVTKDRTAILIGLALVGLLALSAWPVYEYGQAGYDRVLSMADGAGQKYLAYHRRLAERWIFLYFITAGVAGLGCLLTWKWPRTLVFSSVLALALAAGSLAAGVIIAKAGGPIRHREFRSGPPPELLKSSLNSSGSQRMIAVGMGHASDRPLVAERCLG